MSDGSRIEWLARSGTNPATWNVSTGCTKVSDGCRHCYAFTMAARFWPSTQSPLVGADGRLRPRVFTDVQCHENRLDAPLRWKTPRTVFVNSMSDLFHDSVPDEFIDRVFAVMALAQRHTFICLTKRPERMRKWFDDSGFDAVQVTAQYPQFGHTQTIIGQWPLSNVWLGVSVEDQRTADERIPLLLDTPAAVRFISAEPLLGPISFMDNDGPQGVGGEFSVLELGIGWAIVGGESGPKARPCDVAWIRSIVSQCKDASVPVFVKQFGANSVASCYQCGRLIGRNQQGGFVDACGPTHAALIAEMIAVKSNKGADPSEWPADLRVREWPEARR